MLKKRLIPVVQLMGNTVVKTVSFKEPRQVGDAAATVKVFSARNADELILLDIGASLHSKEPDFSFIENTAKNCFMPLSIGGGISTFRCAQSIFDAGADKVVIGRMLYDNPAEVEKIVRQYGSQAVVAALDCVAYENDFVAYKTFGSAPLPLKLKDLITTSIDVGVGEIFLTSVSREGSMSGYDITLLNDVLSMTSLPVIINGGAGGLTDFVQALVAGASGVAASSVYFWEGLTISEIKNSLSEAGIQVVSW